MTIESNVDQQWIVGCRQKIKKIPGLLFWTGSTQGSIWRPFFGRHKSFSLTTRAFCVAPLAAPSWTPLLGQFWLPRQKYYLELEFLDDFHICCTELPPVCRNVSRFQIARLRKKLRPSEDMSFSCFLSAPTWEEPFHTVAQIPGQIKWIWLNFWYFFTKKVPNNIAASRLKISHTYVPLQPFEAMACWNLN